MHINRGVDVVGISLSNKRERYFSHLWPQIPPINLVFGGSFSHREPRSLRSSRRRQKRTTPRQRTPRQRRRARRLLLGAFFFVGHRNPPAAFDFFFAFCRVDRWLANDLSPSLLRRPPREQNDDHDDHPKKNRVRVATPLLLLLLFLFEPVVQQSFVACFAKAPHRKRLLRSLEHKKTPF